MIKTKTMRKLCMAGILLVAVAMAFFPKDDVISADATAVTGYGTLTVGVPKDRCPIFYEDPDTGEITGIGVDLMKEACENVGYDADFVFVEEPNLLDALDNLSYDVVMPFGGAVRSTAGERVVISDNLMQTPFTLVTDDDRELPSFNYIHVGMPSSLGGAAEVVKREYPGIEITMYDTMDDCVRALRAGEVDALLHNSYVWSYVLQKPSYRGLVVQPSAMFSMDFRVSAVDTPAGEAFIERLNAGIADITDTHRQAVILSHTYRKLYRYSLGDYLYQYGFVIVLVVLLLLSLVVSTVLKVRNIRMENDEKMRQLRSHDPMTGVLSLEGFRARVEELLTENPNTQYLLAYTNIRDFKYINDSMGINAADELLIFWAENLKDYIAEDEAVCRPEDDHFVVLRRMTNEKQMVEDGKVFLEPISNYFIDRGQRIKVKLSSGLYVLTPDDYKDINVDHMLDLVRVAEKRARDSRKDGIEIYNPDQWERGKRSSEITGHLPAALKEGEIQVWYQPQVDYRTKEISGAEALCRWEHPKLGFLSPDEFISVLEEAGIMYDLDCYVWDQVCQDLHRWNEAGIKRTVSVNMSRGDIREDRNIPGHFYNLIKQYDLSFDQLHIEITETAYADDSKLLIETTQELRDFGFKVEMDDFGSGYSSLHMLKEVDVDRIKLDLHFLTESGDRGRGQTIISHIIRMIGALGMDVIAEGVEEADQAEFLSKRGCIEMQGYYFYKPMTVEDFEKL